MTKREAVRAELLRYLERPIDFVREWLYAEPTPQQAEALMALPSCPHMAIKAGHGVGKTAFEAWVLCWFLMLHPNCRILATAPTKHQLQDILWPEAAKWINRGRLAPYVQWEAERISLCGVDKATWFAVPRTSNQPENMQGFHEGHVLVIVDEASGVEAATMEVLEGVLTTPNARLIMCGNPTRADGMFFNAFNKDRASYKTFTFSCLESPNVAPAYAERMAKKYGRDSDVYRVRVLGEFPKGSPDTFITLAHVEYAIERECEISPRGSIGVDPARFGDDESSICPRIGQRVPFWRGFHGIDTVRLTAEVLRVAKELRKAGAAGVIDVKVDDTGIGGGVTDQLNAVASEHQLNVIPVSFGGKGDDDYADYAAVMWGNLRETFGSISLPECEETEDCIAQLTSRRYGLDSNGRIKLERKEDMKKRGLHSPDKADALALAFAPVTGVSSDEAAAMRRIRL